MQHGSCPQAGGVAGIGLPIGSQQQQPLQTVQRLFVGCGAQTLAQLFVPPVPLAPPVPALPPVPAVPALPPVPDPPELPPAPVVPEPPSEPAPPVVPPVPMPLPAVPVVPPVPGLPLVPPALVPPVLAPPLLAPPVLAPPLPPLPPLEPRSRPRPMQHGSDPQIGLPDEACEPIGSQQQQPLQSVHDEFAALALHAVSQAAPLLPPCAPVLAPLLVSLSSSPHAGRPTVAEAPVTTRT